MNRFDLISRLEVFYKENGLLPNEEFACKNKDKCKPDEHNFAKGMQCHVGQHYGENCLRVLVVSLDCGNGGAQTIAERTQTVEDVVFESPNPHMKGTIQVISNFLEMDTRDSLTHYAMTNSCKCCNMNSANQLNSIFYERCIEHKLNEIEVLTPNIIYFQGKNSLMGIKFNSIERVPLHLSRYIKYAKINGKNYLSVICIHPSARGRHKTRVKEFYENTIVEINSFIKDNLL